MSKFHVNTGGEIRHTKSYKNVSRNIVSLRSAFFTLREQLAAQQKHCLRVEEICCEK